MEYIEDWLLAEIFTFLFSFFQRCYWSDMFTGRLRSEIPPALVMHLLLDIIIHVKISLGFQSELVEILHTFFVVVAATDPKVWIENPPELLHSFVLYRSQSWCCLSFELLCLDLFSAKSLENPYLLRRQADVSQRAHFFAYPYFICLFLSLC